MYSLLRDGHRGRGGLGSRQAPLTRFLPPAGKAQGCDHYPGPRPPGTCVLEALTGAKPR